MSDLPMSARDRAYFLMSQIDAESDGPTRGDLLAQYADNLIEVVRDSDDYETVSSWSDLFGYLFAALKADVERIGGAA